MTIDLAPALAEFTLGDKTFSVDVCDAELRLVAIDQMCRDAKSAAEARARWQAIADYVTELSDRPCSTTQAIRFYNAVFAASKALLDDDQKKTTTPPASPATSDSTPAPSASENAAAT